MKRSGRQLDKGAIELIEEAVHLLRLAPIAILASYYAGGLPFVLASLYFWADMSRSPFAYQHLAGGALGLAALFVWMKLCHSIFARRLRALMAGEPPPALSFRCYCRIFISQTALQSSGLFVLPFSLVLTVPFAWVYAFYQNLTALDDGEAVDLRSLMKEALLQAGLWPKQNHLLLAILSAFGLVIFLNWSILCLALPGLVKTIFGIESIFSRSVFSLLNTTFFAKAAVYLALVLIVLPQSSLRAADSHKVSAPFPLTPASSSQVAAASPSPEELDRTIETVLQQQKYTWRMPREKLEQPDADKGLIGRFLERLRQWARSLRDWIIEWLRKYFGHRSKSGAESGSGYGWILTLEVLLYALVGAVIAALIIVLYRIFSGRRLKPAIVASEAIQPAPDLTDENLAADALPEDGWTRLGRELLARGELRLALRAFYLASLAHLASRQLDC